MLASILYTCAEALRIITALAYPVLPEAATRIWAQLGLGDIAHADLKDLHWGQLAPGTKLGQLGPIFPRAEKDTVERMNELETKNAGKSAEADPTTRRRPPAPAPQPGAHSGGEAGDSHRSVGSNRERRRQGAGSIDTGRFGGDSTPPSPAADKPATITIDDFAKVELRVAQVLVAEPVKGADRLLRLEVNLGDEVRQIVAGIAGAYEPEKLIGRKVVIVANLQPRKLRGLESNGMIVAASLGEKGKPVLAGFLEDVEIGARLK